MPKVAALAPRNADDVRLASGLRSMVWKVTPPRPGQAGEHGEHGGEAQPAR